MNLLEERVIIFDKQAISQTGLEYLIKQNIPDAIVEVVNTKDELVNYLITSQNRLVIIDYELSDISSADILLNISARFKNLHWLLFSDSLNPLFLKRIVDNDMFSVVLKSSGIKEIIAAIKSGFMLKQFICQQVTDILFDNGKTIRSKLTLTENEILKEIALGKTAKEIAVKRNSSVHTVITHRKNIYKKRDINNAQELTHYAVRAVLINVIDYQI